MLEYSIFVLATAIVVGAELIANALRQSIALEKEIDTEIERVQALLKDKPIKQPNLFTNG